MALVVHIQRSCLKRLLPAINRRFVSTSKKNNDTATVDVCKEDVKVKPTAVVHKDWISYGFDYKSKSEDRTAMHSILFVTITLCMTVGGFYMAYVPDYNLRDWAQREAFLELRRREQNKLPLVDPNLIDPAKIKLPTDEELGDTEIII